MKYIKTQKFKRLKKDQFNKKINNIQKILNED